MQRSRDQWNVRHIIVLIALAGPGLACDGQIFGTGSSGQGEAGPPPTDPGSPGTVGGGLDCTGVSLAPAVQVPMRRLSRVEYDNTVRDLLGVTNNPASAFGVDSAYGGFETNSTTPVTTTDLQLYQSAAETIASSVDIVALAGCGATTVPQLVCQTKTENTTLSLACPAGTVVTSVDFASYGTPQGTCGTYQVGTCKADVAAALKSACLTKASCSVSASNVSFGGDPCLGTPKSLAVQVTCSSSTTGGLTPTACAQKFIATFGTRAFRRPPTTDQVNSLLAVYQDKLGRSDHAAALRLVLSAMLQSPYFLYRPDSAPLDTYALATRLSYFLWQTMPDVQLLERAHDGSLASNDVLLSEVKRLMADARFSDSVRSFYRQWLWLSKLDTLDKDTTLFPIFTPAVRAAMKEGTLSFVEDLFHQDAPTYAELMTAPYTFVNADLAPLYGLSATGPGFVRIQPPSGQRAGLLTQASLMSITSFADHSSPLHRGLFIRRQLLCNPVPSPPPNIPAAPKVDPNVSVRDRLAQHRVDPTCNACHSLMDPVGLGFEHYDAVGRWRTMDGKFVVDATGQVTRSGDSTVDGPFDGALELAGKLAHSAQAERCMTEQSLRFAMGRPQTPAEACAVSALAKAFIDSGGDLKSLLLAIVQSDVFRQAGPNL